MIAMLNAIAMLIGWIFLSAMLAFGVVLVFVALSARAAGRPPYDPDDEDWTDYAPDWRKDGDGPPRRSK